MLLSGCFPELFLIMDGMSCLINICEYFQLQLKIAVPPGDAFFFSLSGVGSLLPDRHAGAFSVPVAGAAESAAGCAVVPGRSAGTGSGEARERPHPERGSRASDGAG